MASTRGRVSDREGPVSLSPNPRGDLPLPAGLCVRSQSRGGSPTGVWIPGLGLLGPLPSLPTRRWGTSWPRSCSTQAGAVQGGRAGRMPSQRLASVASESCTWRVVTTVLACSAFQHSSIQETILASFKEAVPLEIPSLPTIWGSEEAWKGVGERWNQMGLIWGPIFNGEKSQRNFCN